ncbi:3-keto-disaccharide hydrolase [Paraglaciecola chathamensis]|uniref:3-keto-alpha-glucoside-1,2-lyase/3-keto-2-hydroxy-glucal hydratase domain-containing protein n=1 Tax=Paraglaciecola chathamensis S18K6 TaxID=1127672 RepID=A0AAV3V7T9_9ALTE|nr:DUF1080 domain-containing protein [Paraglaciecola chathamensis]GAC12635.1 hypothetical protein GCHA_4718 [Paraglaciecola chathamensis S18K6]
MKISTLFIVLLLATISYQSLAQQSLIDDKLSNFENVYTYGHAEVVNNELHLISQKNWFLSTKAEYSDFVLQAQVKMPNTSEYSNSGIIFRGQIVDTDNGKQVIGYQAEVDPSDRKWTGALFDQSRRKWLYPTHPTRSHRDEDFIRSHLGAWRKEQRDAYKHLEWNTLKIVCIGSELKIYVNGTLTTHVEDSKDRKGVIAFQHHGSKIYKDHGDTTNIVAFRNITIESL